MVLMVPEYSPPMGVLDLRPKLPLPNQILASFWAIYGPKFIFSIFLHNFTQVGLDQGVYGLRSDAPMGGEYLGTIRNIADGIKSK